MYKIYNAFICGKEFCCSKKPLLIMKLTMVLLTMAFLQASAKSSGVVGTTTEVAQKTITGKVVDEKGLPIPGVYVKSKSNPANATATDAQGNYKLVSTDDDAVIIYSFVGYETQEQPSRGKTVINVTMVPTNSNLEEVVVVAYGAQKRTSLTDAVSTINAAEIQRNSVTDLTNAIVGRTPGVRVTVTDSRPGKYDTNIDIRGFTGANNSGSPLFVIDGIPRDKSSFDHLDANEIETFSVLKDASSAIYGVQGANGVILVTTRKGAAGKVKVNYTGQYGQVRITTYPDLMNAYQEESTYDEMQFNNMVSGRGDPITPLWTYQQIQDAYNGKGTNTDWIKVLENGSSRQNQHNVNISGGSDQVQFFTSGGYIYEGGLLSTGIEHSQKYNARQSITAKLSKNLTFDLNIGFIDNILSEPNQSSGGYNALTRNTWSFTPADPVYLFDNPKYFNMSLNNQIANPLALITPSAAGYEVDNNKFFTSVTSLTWQVPFIKGLSAKAVVAWDNNNGLTRNFQKSWNQYSYTVATNTLVTYPINTPSKLQQNYSESIRNDLQFQLTYNKHIGKHNFSLLALYEQVYNESDATNAFTNFAIDAIPLLASGVTTGQTVSGGKSENSNLSYVGRLNYDYAGKYLLEGGFRYVGSSWFPKNSRWGFFPYVSGGWRISEEPFIKDNLKFVDNIKLRASYGTTGDDQAASGGNFPAFLTGFTYPGPNSVFSSAAGRSGQSQQGAVFGTAGITKAVAAKPVANPNITWYTSTQTDIGLETSFWHGLLTAEFDVFQRNRSGILATQIVAIPGNFGATLPQVNLNSDRTRGFEITMGHRDVVGEVSYGISANMGFTRSNWNHFEETPATDPYNNWTSKNTGRYVDYIRGYVTDGQYQSVAEIQSNPVIIDGSGNRSILPGDLRYVDINNNGVKDGNDQTILANGGSKPLIYFGTTIDVTYKGFDLTLLVQGATDYNVRYTDGLSIPFVRNPQTPITRFIDRWHHQDLFDQNSPWVPGRYPSTGGRQNSLDQASSFTTFDGTYARLKQVQIGYTLPRSLLSKINVSKVRLFVSAFNLLTWQKAGLDFVDPEYTSGNGSYNAPITANITAGANITF